MPHSARYFAARLVARLNNQYRSAPKPYVLRNHFNLSYAHLFYFIMLLPTFVLILVELKQSSFSLIQPHFVKLIQLVQFDKTNHAWQCKELVIVLGTGGTESSVAYQGEHLTFNLRSWVQFPPRFCLVLNILTNLTNLTNLFKS